MITRGRGGKNAKKLIPYHANDPLLILIVIVCAGIPVSRISRDGETFLEEILDLGGNFGIQEEIFTGLERINF